MPSGSWNSPARRASSVVAVVVPISAQISRPCGSTTTAIGVITPASVASRPSASTGVSTGKASRSASWIPATRVTVGLAPVAPSIRSTRMASASAT
jgi:hypothetical protein